MSNKVFWTWVIIMILATISLFINGCAFGRADYRVEDDFSQETTYASITVWTFLKEVNIEALGYESDNNEVNVFTPWGSGGTK